MAPKIQFAAQLVAASQEKVLVFSAGETAVALRLLQDVLTARGIHTVHYHGGLQPADRKDMLCRFCKDPKVRALLMTYKIGGTGLNLQFAPHIILLDPNFSPAVTEQAIARAYRSSRSTSTEPRPVVYVYRLISRNSYEDSVMARLDTSKRKLMGIICNESTEQRDLFQYLQTHQQFSIWQNNRQITVAAVEMPHVLSTDNGNVLSQQLQIANTVGRCQIFLQVFKRLGIDEAMKQCSQPFNQATVEHLGVFPKPSQDILRRFFYGDLQLVFDMARRLSDDLGQYIPVFHVNGNDVHEMQATGAYGGSDAGYKGPGGAYGSSAGSGGGGGGGGGGG